MASITCGNCKATHTSVAEVRACFDNVSRVVSKPTQESFNLTPALPAAPKSLDIQPSPAPKSPTGYASTLYQSPAPRTTAPSAPTVKVGIYRHNEEIYQVAKTRNGRSVAKRFTGSKYVYERGTIYKIKPSERVTVGEAAAYGVSTGICMCCGRTLTHPDSVQLGIGPVCKGKYF